MTIGSYDLELFDDQVNFLSIIFEYVLRTIKGKDLVQLYPNDPIQLWKKLLYHHRGSDASIQASSRLLQRLGTISIGDFSSRSLFLQEYAKIIEYYNETNTAAMQANMKDVPRLPATRLKRVKNGGLGRNVDGDCGRKG